MIMVAQASRLCGFTENRLKISGGHSAGATPDPIPNSAVKPGHADDTTWVTAWESRTPPDLISY